MYRLTFGEKSFYSFLFLLIFNFIKSVYRFFFFIQKFNISVQLLNWWPRWSQKLKFIYRIMSNWYLDEARDGGRGRQLYLRVASSRHAAARYVILSPSPFIQWAECPFVASSVSPSFCIDDISIGNSCPYALINLMDKACKEPRHSWRDQNRNSIEKKEKKG